MEFFVWLTWSFLSMYLRRTIKPRVENKQKISNRLEKENENKEYEYLAFGLKLMRRIRAESNLLRSEEETKAYAIFWLNLYGLDEIRVSGRRDFPLLAGGATEALRRESTTNWFKRTFSEKGDTTKRKRKDEGEEREIGETNKISN